MLPGGNSHRRRLAEVIPNCLDAVRGRRGAWGLPSVEKAVVVLVDGLGHEALVAARGHARTLATGAGADTAIGSGFPSTTAAALATLTTGEPSGRHGLVAYRGYDPARDVLVNQLSGWEGLDPATWQRMPTLFERASAEGIPSAAIAHARYRESAFTHAVLRGAEFLGAAQPSGRLDLLGNALSAPGPALIYYYVPELDMTAHARGASSDAWLAALEEFDAELSAMIRMLGRRDGLVVTADHGIVDVPEQAHRIPEQNLLDDVAHVAGEPRCLQLHLQEGTDPHAVAERWRSSEGRRAWVATRDEAIEAGWFGTVDPEVAPRIGDVLIAARGTSAYYVDPDDRARAMIGQHGSLTPSETGIPFVRFGAFA
ncbi:alkaline phosphatase family protein [Homoserinibacter sp. GY 40078]|uniref:alkaline phosphatase family protein n=1 Tax=Homoserinibacter sp. GY 40078 TaxID=2603275 RepID=UPI0011CBAF84|nr:alkaline phosphatase family protein [Homoserinibacter sp. GY 40078]TXK17491.1 alkaline phosphatase family protein [Homoserinibacter sp. GY 40078]